jgi:hypothetical protein
MAGCDHHINEPPGVRVPVRRWRNYSATPCIQDCCRRTPFTATHDIVAEGIKRGPFFVLIGAAVIDTHNARLVATG